MKSNFLKLKDNKTEFLIFGSHQQLSKISIEHINVGDSSIASVSQARNLGIRRASNRQTKFMYNYWQAALAKDHVYEHLTNPPCHRGSVNP